MGSLFNELKRRNVFKVATAYVVVSWLILQVLSSVVPIIEAPDWVSKVVLILLLVGMPIALLFAWAFEMTPDGVKKTADVTPETSIAQETSQKINYIIIGALVLIIGGMAYTGKFSEGTNTPEVTGEIAQAEKSVAVLPFVNMSSDKEQEWFSDGLTEEILNSLAMLPELQVTARTSSFHFKGQNIPINEIAEKLNVEYIVEGSVRRGGDTLRITAQLIRAGEDTHLWSKTYDQPADNILDVQRDVAEQIALALDIYMDDARRAEMFTAGTRNVEAFKAYHKGSAISNIVHNRNSDDSLWDAVTFFEKAIAADPKFSAAYMSIQDAYAHFLMQGPNSVFLEGREPAGLTVEIALKTLRGYQSQAIALADNPARKVSAELARVFQSDTWRAMPRLLDEIRKNPEAIARASGSSWFVETMFLLGETPRLIPYLKQRVERNLYGRINWEYLINSYHVNGEIEEALKVVSRAETFGFNNPQGRHILHMRMGNTAILQQEYDSFVQREKRIPMSLLYALGKQDEVKEGLADLEKNSENISASNWILFYSWAGEQEKADAWAKQLDTMPLNALSFSLIVESTGTVGVSKKAVPNLVRKMREAGLSEEKIDRLILPRKWGPAP